MRQLNFIAGLFFAGTLLFSACNCGNSNQETKKEITVEIKVKKEQVTFPSQDSLTISGDLYTRIDEENLPFILLFHQAGYSRGEYYKTADKFIERGFNVLAIDARSGKSVNDVENLTHKRAVEQGLPTEYVDAMPDLLAAIDYIHEKFQPSKLVVLGSSYSATLSLIIGATYPEKVDAVMAFSPGEYFTYNEHMIKDFAREIDVPVFITSAKSEFNNWKEIFESIPGNKKQKFIPEVEGIHGSRALWETTAGNDKYWNAVDEFLEKL